MLRARSFAMGITIGVLVSRGCSVAGGIQDAGAQTSGQDAGTEGTAGVTHELLRTACTDVATGEENGEPYVILFDDVENTDAVIGLTYGRRTADGEFIATSGVPVVVESSQIKLTGNFAGAFVCNDGDIINIVVARLN